MLLQVILLTYDNAEVRRIWPQRQDLQSFLLSSGNYLIKDTLRHMMTDLSSHMLQSLKDVEHNFQNLNDHMTSLTSYTEQYLVESAIDQEFVR